MKFSHKVALRFSCSGFARCGARPRRTDETCILVKRVCNHVSHWLTLYRTALTACTSVQHHAGLADDIRIACLLTAEDRHGFFRHKQQGYAKIGQQAEYQEDLFSN